MTTKDLKSYDNVIPGEKNSKVLYSDLSNFSVISSVVTTIFPDP